MLAWCSSVACCLTPAPLCLCLQLAKRCVLFALEHYDDITRASSAQDYCSLMNRMLPHLHTSLLEDVSKVAPAP